MAMSGKSNVKIIKRMAETEQVDAATKSMSTDSEHGDNSETDGNYTSGSSIRGVEDPPPGGSYCLDPKVEI